MLEKRTTEIETMEQLTCDEALAEQGYRLMMGFNRRFSGSRVVRNFIRREVEKIPLARPLRVLDIGSGSCDIPLAVSRWCRQHGLAVDFTCVERHPVGIKIARQTLQEAADPCVSVVQANIFDYQPAEPFDFAVGSLFFHHFTDEEILRLIRHLKTFVTHSLLINDLLRYTPNYLVAYAVTMFLPKQIRQDVKISFRRGFKLTELRHLIQKVEGVTVTVNRNSLFRALAKIQFS
jgi:SAM-dependent methyltransferase